MAERGKHHRNHFFGNAVGVRARRVHHVDIFFAGVNDVDIVKTRAGAHDKAQFRQRVDDFRSYFFTADDKHARIRMRRDNFPD